MNGLSSSWVKEKHFVLKWKAKVIKESSTIFFKSIIRLLLLPLQRSTRPVLYTHTTMYNYTQKVYSAWMKPANHAVKCLAYLLCVRNESIMNVFEIGLTHRIAISDIKLLIISCFTQQQQQRKISLVSWAEFVRDLDQRTRRKNIRRASNM